MRFLICDNDITYRTAIEKKLTDIKKQFMIIEVKKALKLKSAISLDTRYISQIAIIDNNFENDALTCAKMLINNNKGLRIIWTGNTPLSALDGLESYTIGFIKKPINDEQFIKVIEKTIEDYNRYNIQFQCPVRKSHSYETFWVNDIRSIKTYYNDLTITLCNGETRDCHVKSRYHLRNALGCRWFLRINENIMVNMNEIDILSDKLCILKTHEVYKVSKVYSNTIIKKYKLFIKNKTNNYYIFNKDINKNILKTSYPRTTSMF